MSELREKLAELEHEQWVAWSKSIAKSKRLSESRLKRWSNLWIPYSRLSEKDKDLDREWADKAIAIIEKEIGSAKIEKNFSTAKKLTEGDNAFQQYAMENKDINGSSTPPIDIEEPPVCLKKNISTMAPKEQIGENGIDNEIEFDNAVDKIKKDYSGGVAFSTQHQVPGEMSNQISAPEKVDASVETKKRTNVTNNKEPFFCKMIEKDGKYIVEIYKDA